MSIPEGYVLALFVITLFVTFSILKIKESKKDAKKSGKITSWISKFQIASASVVLVWALFLSIIIVVAILIFLFRK